MRRLHKHYSLKMLVLLALVFLLGQLVNVLHDSNATEHDPNHACIACLHTFTDRTDADQDDSLDDSIDISLLKLSQYESLVLKSDLTLNNRTIATLSPKQYLPLSRGPPVTYS